VKFPAAGDPPPAVACRNLRFAYRGEHDVIDIPELTIARGDSLFLHGPSGSGKTTLLGLLAGVLAPTAGEVRVLGANLAGLSAAGRDAFRAEHTGYVFQMFNLIPYLSVLDNITLACRLSAKRRARLRDAPLEQAAAAIATELGIAGLLGKRVTELSVGQQQRVAAARALLGAPELVIADEPTSALDTDHREAFLRLLFASCARAGATLVFVSHELTLRPLFTHALDLAALNRIPARGAA
jgi:putative ABC transport system ATP-binding protein